MTTSIKDVKIHRKSKFKIVSIASIVFKITTKLKNDEQASKDDELASKDDELASKNDELA